MNRAKAIRELVLQYSHARPGSDKAACAIWSAEDVMCGSGFVALLGRSTVDRLEFRDESSGRVMIVHLDASGALHCAHRDDADSLLSFLSE